MLSKEILSENLLDVENLIYSNVHKFIHSVVKAKRYVPSSDYESLFAEAMSEAYLAFLTACEGYDRTRALFSTHVTNQIRYRLLDWWTATLTAADRYRTNMDDRDGDDSGWFSGVQDEAKDSDNSIRERKRFSIQEFLSMLSDDAQAVVKMVVDDSASPDVWDWMWHGVEWRDSEGLPESPHCARRALRQRLSDWGWSAERIAATWAEAKELLCREKVVIHECRKCRADTANAGRVCTPCLGVA